MNRIFALGLIGLLAALIPGAEIAPGLHAPPGFIIERILADPDVVFPMFAALRRPRPAVRGRVVRASTSTPSSRPRRASAASACSKIPDGAAAFASRSVFADKLVFPMGLAWRDGKLYVADPPDLVTLEDTDGDGRADRRTVILTGFGHNDNGSLHGLTFGPDGRALHDDGQPGRLHASSGATGTVLHGKSGALSALPAGRLGPGGAVPRVREPGRGRVHAARRRHRHRQLVPAPDAAACATRWSTSSTAALYPCHPRSRHPAAGHRRPLAGGVAVPGRRAERAGAATRARRSPAMRGNLFSAQHNARKVGRHVLVPARLARSARRTSTS